jgi:UDP-N-acetylmuramoyl-L-alanyl-D-glutamate--2,6-diaminopimelate ligase
LITGIKQSGGIRLDAVPELLGDCRVTGNLKGECVGVTYDSRTVNQGVIFAALEGLQTTGESFVKEAVKRGAVAVLGHGLSMKGRQVPYLEVPDPRRSMAQIACALNGNPSRHLKVVGITGTNGKTTVSFLVRDILRAAGCRPGLVGTLRYEIGDRKIPARRTTPEAPDLQQLLYEMLRAQCDSVSMEVSSHALDQYRVDGVDFDVAVFTNLSHDHLDYHRSMDAYFEKKALLFQTSAYAGPHTTRVINLDDPWGRKLALRGGSRGNLITYGKCPEARVRAESIEMDLHGTQFMAHTPWGTGKINLNLLGLFNLQNALAALAAGGALGIEFPVLVHALQQAEAVPGRLETIPNAQRIDVFVDYAHTEDALDKVLGTLREMTDGNLICVFGCGGDRDHMKRPRMGEVAARHADFLVLTSDNPRSEDPDAILREIMPGCRAAREVRSIVDRKEAIAEALGLARPGDTVLIAGKGHETVQEIGEERVPFDDREFARELLDEMDRKQRGF